MLGSDSHRFYQLQSEILRWSPTFCHRFNPDRAGRLHIDNNLCENAIRPFVIGRKNSLFSDMVSGAKASANLYSLIETARANGLEPYAYLKQVFTELPKATSVEDIEALLPFQPAPVLD